MVGDHIRVAWEVADGVDVKREAVAGPPSSGSPAAADCTPDDRANDEQRGACQGKDE